jgi:threonylcarbamoyladenosine tRNA methylthiotransferase MtaB
MPGETEDEFEETCRFFERGPLDYAHVFIYSARPGTPAAAFPDHVDPRVMQQRSERVRQISDGKWRRFCERFLGRTMDVLFEQKLRGRWMGYTGNYIAVAACSDDDLTNAIRPVVLESVTGETVQGILADE